MYSVIHPTEVLDEEGNMVSTWEVLATDLLAKVQGYHFISENVPEDLKEYTWVVKTSDILKFVPEELMHIVIAFNNEDEL